jgi:signal transduction histidine kinase
MDRRVPEPGANDEVGRLARTMNSMLDRLEISARRQRQFVSDASHELRSPIAVIRTQLEVALRRPDRADWPEVAHRVLTEDERLADAVSELLELARAEELALDHAVSVDLEEIVLAGRHATSKVAVTVEVADGLVRLTVDDDGPGIAPADHLRVFDRFTRLDEGRARDAGGVGLGLAMARTIVVRHGGSMRVEDAPLGGARFVVELPAA